MSTKSDLLKEIEAKAQKIREKRVEAAGNKTIENAVFEFFKNVEESRKLHNNEKHDLTLVQSAHYALEERLKAFDNRVKCSVEWNVLPEEAVEKGNIRGITIWWSPAYIKKHNCDQSLYIDVTQLLLI